MSWWRIWAWSYLPRAASIVHERVFQRENFERTVMNRRRFLTATGSVRAPGPVRSPLPAIGQSMPLKMVIKRRVGLTLGLGRSLMHGVDPQMCGQVASPLLGCLDMSVQRQFQTSVCQMKTKYSLASSVRARF